MMTMNNNDIAQLDRAIRASMGAALNQNAGPSVVGRHPEQGFIWVDANDADAIADLSGCIMVSRFAIKPYGKSLAAEGLARFYTDVLIAHEKQSRKARGK